MYATKVAQDVGAYGTSESRRERDFDVILQRLSMTHDHLEKLSEELGRVSVSIAGHQPEPASAIPSGLNPAQPAGCVIEYLRSRCDALESVTRRMEQHLSALGRTV